MIKHFITIIYRSFLRSKGYFLINLFGLAAGMTCTLLIYVWVRDEWSINKFHTNDDRLYQVMENQQYAAEIGTTSSTPGALAENLKADYPEIEYAATITWIADHLLSVKDKNVKAKGYDVGADYFKIFTHKIIEGNPDKLLTEKFSIVISRSLAKKIFGTDKDVVGKAIEVDRHQTLHVTGVFEDVPSNSQYQFDYVDPYQLFLDKNKWLMDWGNNGPSTMIVLKDDADKVELENKIKDYVKKRNEGSNVDLFLEKFSDRYLYGDYKNGVRDGGRIEYVELFSIIAVFILMIACINFMNLSTARATRKSKEVGIKKTVGAGRQSLIYQYLSESLITAGLALVISVLIAWAMMPVFNIITGKHISLNLLDPWLLLWLLGTTIVTGLIAGSYPALYLSGFKPAAVLKGEVKGSVGELLARKGLVIIQFFLSVILIVSVIVVYKQLDFVLTQDLGYEKNHLISVTREGKLWENKTNLNTFLEEVRKVPGVVDAASIGHNLMGQNRNTSGLSWPGKNPDDRILFEIIAANDHLFETLGFQFVEGHGFSGNSNPADTTKIIFNEAAIDIMGLENPIGKHIKFGDSDVEIIGVVKNFNFKSLFDPVTPLLFQLDEATTWNIMIRTEPGKEKDVIAKVDKIHKTLNPGFDLDFEFQDEKYARLYESEERIAALSAGFATIAIVISCLGLFGLAAFTAERRLKEIGIRKALGCSSTKIVLLLSGDFSRLVIIGVILGLPVGYYILDLWLSEFAYHIPLRITYFVVAGVVALAVAWVTVASQAIKASQANPVDCLRTE